MTIAIPVSNVLKMAVNKQLRDLKYSVAVADLGMGL